MWLSWIALDGVRNVSPGSNHLKMIRTMYNKILEDDFLWADIVWRHGFFDALPWNAENENKAAYDHAIGNFWGYVSAMRYEKES